MQIRLTQLDGLRGIAVALVVVHHFSPIGHALGLGNIGVQLFFVLSGFLITGILLDHRSALEAGTSDLRRALVTFWQSRAARILPVVFVTLAAVFLAGDRFARREDMLWHFAFASNLLFFHRGEFGSSLAHFWTLAVEQQFYLVWPLLILFIPRRFLEASILSLVVLAPVTRLLLYTAGYDNFAQFNVLPFSNFDSLGLGALIATWKRLPDARARSRWRLLSAFGLVSALAVVANRYLGPLPANMEQSLYAIAFAWVIAAASEGMPGLAKRLLEWRPLVGLGVISYGVYAYHVFAPRLVGAGLRALDAPTDLQSGVPLFVLSATLTLAAASLSWLLMERPINEARRNWQRRAQLRPKLTAA
jgi:peptidoglycan/LPS O-acetylase OafA/YrhL